MNARKRSPSSGSLKRIDRRSVLWFDDNVKLGNKIINNDFAVSSRNAPAYPDTSGGVWASPHPFPHTRTGTLSQLPTINRAWQQRRSATEARRVIKEIVSLRDCPSDRLPGSADCNLPIVSKNQGMPVTFAGDTCKTGYVSVEDGRQVPRPPISSIQSDDPRHRNTRADLRVTYSS